MSDTDFNEKPMNISTKTNIQMGVLVALLTPLAGTLIMVFSLLLSIEAMKKDIALIKDAESNKWTFQHQLIWSDRLKGMNTNLQVPSVQGVEDDLRRVR